MGKLDLVNIDYKDVSKAIVKLLEQVNDKKEVRRITSEVAEAIIVPAMESNSPEFDNRRRSNITRETQPKVLKTSEHYRYNTPKLVSGIKAGKGRGRIVQTTKGGNIKKSIHNLLTHPSKRRDFKNARGAIVGPVYRRTSAKVIGRNKRNADGWYAHMIYGSARAFQSEVTTKTVNQVRSRAAKLTEIKVRKYVDKTSKANGFR